MAKLVSSSLANLKIINKIFVYFNGHLKAIIPLFTLCITPLYFAYQQIVEKAEVGHILHINTEFPLIMTPNRNVVKKMIGSRKIVESPFFRDHFNHLPSHFRHHMVNQRELTVSILVGEQGITGSNTFR